MAMPYHMYVPQLQSVPPSGGVPAQPQIYPQVAPPVSAAYNPYVRLSLAQTSPSPPPYVQQYPYVSPPPPQRPFFTSAPSRLGPPPPPVMGLPHMLHLMAPPPTMSGYAILGAGSQSNVKKESVNYSKLVTYASSQNKGKVSLVYGYNTMSVDSCIYCINHLEIPF